jgi:hypothetical protein
MEEISAVNKIIFSSTSAGSINYRCQKKYMNAGIQPQCQHDGDKRWPGAYSMYVPPPPSPNSHSLPSIQ